MATISWPTNLPQRVSWQGLQVTPESVIVEDPTDSGRPSVRRTDTKSNYIAECQLELPTSDYIVFDTFFRDTAKGGALKFDWVRPDFETPEEVWFTGGDYSARARGGNFWEIRFRLRWIA